MLADQFYLGVHRPNWVTLEEFSGVPLFLSRRQIEDRMKTLPKRAVTRWALDSGGFTELDQRGEWSITPEQYVADVRRYRDGLGMMDWASPQDWMCEPQIRANTGLTVRDHIHRTVENYLTLHELAPEIEWARVVQGWEKPDYEYCVRVYESCGVDLTTGVVGVGSVCRRQNTDEIGEIFRFLHEDVGLKNLHGFGVKAQGLSLYHEHLKSSDSMAWSLRARWAAKTRRDAGLGPGSMDGCDKTTCNNCPHWAISWRANVLATLTEGAPS